MLQLDGRLTRSAANGADATELFEAFGPEGVFLDIRLPDIDGYEVARRMREAAWGRQAGLVALTGWGQAGDKRRATEAGFTIISPSPSRLARRHAIALLFGSTKRSVDARICGNCQQEHVELAVVLT